jgi:hypothetical protein
MPRHRDLLEHDRFTERSTCSGSGTAVMVSPVLSRYSILAKRPADDDERAPYATTGIADHRADSR